MSACYRMLGPVRSAILHGSTRRHDSNSHDHGGVHSLHREGLVYPKAVLAQISSAGGTELVTAAQHLDGCRTGGALQDGSASLMAACSLRPAMLC